MFTSCGWFFDDSAGLECIQILRYAKRAFELFSELEENGGLTNLKSYPIWVNERFEEGGVRSYASALEIEFVNRLSEMESTAKNCNGRLIWENCV